MKTIMQRLLKPPVNGPAATVLLRLMCGGVFFWEGILKFVYANQGVGRFTKLGIPMPGATADFVAVLEIVGGNVVALGSGSRDQPAELLLQVGDRSPGAFAHGRRGSGWRSRSRSTLPLHCGPGLEVLLRLRPSHLK